MNPTKRFFIIMVVFSLALFTNVAIAEVEGIKIPKEVMESAVINNDPTPLIRDYLFPYLEQAAQAALLFSAELAISNGHPPTHDFGERGIFGGQENNGTIMAHLDEKLPLTEEATDEMYRLIFGPWANKGKTVLSFSTLKNARELSYETGVWNQKRNTFLTIRIEHTTEMDAVKRITHLSCDYKTLYEGSHFLVTFTIVRQGTK